MKRYSPLISIFWILSTISIHFSLLAEDYTIVVVVNKQNDTSELSKKELIDIYMGRYQSFPNGSSAQPIDYPTGSDVKIQFYDGLIGQTETQINSYWSRLIFSGTAAPPLKAKNESDVFSLITNDKRSLAYLPKSKVTEEMKIVYQFSLSLPKE
ncbi:hypothetical protein J3L16_14885 [Alteromonas sp. 5E99-2]|uniref:hypothetical protein n=1 Tax=Alteromonas sp. 5E99-2 TaxID=2817683 RepID=UPI001A98377A|nr:hypothetical protein [Alteromonas sp. 5E99-2]MBO1256978.1 hypothetical protein [Alteromonas sp. 5E99-2]